MKKKTKDIAIDDMRYRIMVMPCLYCESSVRITPFSTFDLKKPNSALCFCSPTCQDLHYESIFNRRYCSEWGVTKPLKCDNNGLPG